MTNPSEKQVASTYPYNFNQAVLPEHVHTADCHHEDDPPVGACVHDWRIHWGEVDKTGEE